MSGTVDKLVYMANQIAGAFRHQVPDKAVAATYDHIWHFWDPRMRRLITDHQRAGGVGLNDVARAAVDRLVTTAEARPATRATEFSGRDGADTMSDAG